MAERIRVMIADDHPVVREGLAAMLARGTDAVPLADGGAISLSAVLDQAKA